MYLGPLIFREVFKAKPWGGRAMARVSNKRLPPGEPIGESWELADHPHGMSIVAEGPLAGETLRELMRKHTISLLGRRAGKSRFPLIIKLLDARERLSVQVHPDDAGARAMRLNDTGKTEAWLVLHVRPGGSITAGVKSKRDVPRLREIARSGALGDRMRVIYPKRGEALLCRAGTIHALGPGVVLLEVQQNSDSTFRLYDWGRPGLDGKLRPLHIEESICAVGDKTRTLERQRPKVIRGLPFPASRLLTCDKFVIDRWQVCGTALRKKQKKFEILHVIQGVGRLVSPHWPVIRLTRGRTVLVPACVRGCEIVPSRPLSLIRIAEPE